MLCLVVLLAGLMKMVLLPLVLHNLLCIVFLVGVWEKLLYVTMLMFAQLYAM